MKTLFLSFLSLLLSLLLTLCAAHAAPITVTINSSGALRNSATNLPAGNTGLFVRALSPHFASPGGGGGSTQSVTAAFGSITVTQSINGVKVYKALISQAATSDPVPTVLENSLGFSPVWSRTGVGTYLMTGNGVVTNNSKSLIVAGLADGSPGFLLYNLGWSGNGILIGTDNGDGWTSSIQIFVYP